MHTNRRRHTNSCTQMHTNSDTSTNRTHTNRHAHKEMHTHTNAHSLTFKQTHTQTRWFSYLLDVYFTHLYLKPAGVCVCVFRYQTYILWFFRPCQYRCWKIMFLSPGSQWFRWKRIISEHSLIITRLWPCVTAQVSFSTFYVMQTAIQLIKYKFRSSKFKNTRQVWISIKNDSLKCNAVSSENGLFVIKPFYMTECLSFQVWDMMMTMMMMKVERLKLSYRFTPDAQTNSTFRIQRTNADLVS